MPHCRHNVRKAVDADASSITIMIGIDLQSMDEDDRLYNLDSLSVLEMITLRCHLSQELTHMPLCKAEEISSRQSGVLRRAEDGPNENNPEQ
ncbi:hypothetical protein SNOG_20080 [Parastagonospora nodorum SN15]|uniref:Uncharacterized protein n=1 Tax=Phaeosphaeria nodorum (strain SN15 / ATCC MYA-4574 / FGSC 10173) TaxID=321614 RepID=A9JX77_PHANO|nr:hypothetical protein SNOG_20080 [Parastagonospora nodorum SN15]EDP89769.1 hypothetical protein SNOG_20080 [Parastagonospora nodorum SN15]